MESLKEKKDLHLLRKIWHSIPGISLSVLVSLKIYPLSMVILTLGLLFVLVSMVELLRLNYRHFNRITIKLSKLIMRKEELKQVSGIPYYLGSCFLVLLIFNQHIAVLSILYLAVGDPIASLFGIKYGNNGYKFNNGKSLIGTLAGISFCMVVTMIYGTLMNLPIHIIYPMAFFGSISAGLAETFVMDDINDNLFIPIVSATVLSIVYSNLLN